jgi:hypothetical protein
MRKLAIGLVVTGVAASLVLGACSSSSKSSSTGVATSGASTKVSSVPPAHTGNSVVSVAAAARSHPRAPAVAALLTRRYTDINERNFDEYWKMYTPKYRATFNPAQVAAGYRSTKIFDIHLTELSTSGDGRLAATVKFTSNQDAADAPNGQKCTQWTVGFFLKNVGGAYLIDKPPSTYHSKHAAC